MLMPKLMSRTNSPPPNRNGMTGTMAPATKARKEPPAADHGEADPVLVEPQLLPDQRLEGHFGVLEDVLREPPRVLLRESLRAVDRDELLELLVRDRGQLGALEGDLALQHLHLRPDRDVLPGRHREGAGEEPGDPREEDDGWLGRGAGDAHDEREVAHEAVRRAEDDRPERSRTAAVPVLGLGDLGDARGDPAAALGVDGGGRRLVAGVASPASARSRRGGARRRPWPPSLPSSRHPAPRALPSRSAARRCPRASGRGRRRPACRGRAPRRG